VTVINKGTIIIQKNTVGEDGTFDFTGDMGDFSITTDAGTGSSIFSDVISGSYSVSENALAGWDQTSATCDDGSTVSAIDVGPGETVTCTFTNTKHATLTVTKVVINDNGGTMEVSNFPLFVGLTSVASGVADDFAAGTYTISETGASGYTATISGDCAPDGSVTLAPGDNKACTITNNDNTPSLIVVKLVTNNNGGNNGGYKPGNGGHNGGGHVIITPPRPPVYHPPVYNPPVWLK